MLAPAPSFLQERTRYDLAGGAQVSSFQHIVVVRQQEIGDGEEAAGICGIR